MATLAAEVLLHRITLTSLFQICQKIAMKGNADVIMTSYSQGM